MERARFVMRRALCAGLVLLVQEGCFFDPIFTLDGDSAPDVGDACEGTEPPQCSAEGYKSSCIQGVWTSVECRGPRGCNSFSVALCDQRLGVVGARCDPQDRWTSGTCAWEGSAELRCSEAGVFEKVRECPGGCEPDAEGFGIHCRE